MRPHVPDEPARLNERTPLSRRRLAGLFGLAASAGMLGLAGCGTKLGQMQALASGSVPASRPDGVLGANFNGDPRTVTFPELRAIDTSWLRGFYPMHEADKGDPAQQPEIRMLLDAADRGYGTTLSLKFQNRERPIPRPGSPEMTAELARVDKVLSGVLNEVDILTIGNEPFLETQKNERDKRLNEYYEAITQHVIDQRTQRFGQNSRTRLFMGALNHLDSPDGQTASTARWVDYARRTPAIEGVDIHPHVDSPAGVDKYVDYVLPKLRKDQSFLVTEFSLVRFWKSKLTEPVSDEFARRYGFRQGTPVWEVVRAAIDHPVPQQQWNDFLSSSPWYEQHKHFLRDQVQRFRNTGKLALATYGIGQDAAMVRDFGPDKTPWLFNSLFASKTVQPGPDGLPGRGYAWIEDFRALQRQGDHRLVR
ncbi:hypothetical protein [Saccharopolyspora phatthalungensis]|uniref:Uncharacterized protein n=1 Tax=Saccharopolyspora phatthalungensis TaxID=664693 RepID=A0A840QJJ0_9PSEU|nr:hypothetical protein [Saccharopolyspora phatthalungensis]MBB5159219.1 hypothetical protein [Saccharopolyspora phatthalungensis]